MLLPHQTVKAVPASHTFLLACSLLIATLGCGGEDPNTPPEVTEVTSSLGPSNEEIEIVAAARNYLNEASDVDSTDLAIVAIQGDYVRILATPPPDQADPATLFLHKTEHGWEGIALGTMFTQDDFDALGIPNALRELED